jgi:EAL domain-containing protein (putative c-di-GMP-specific phosphodiesterase class I)
MACIQLTLRTAEANRLPLNRLIFEFTENERMTSTDHVGAIIETYRKMGFSVALDDFGAGHAGLTLFTRFSTDIVKLDMDLIRGIDTDRRRQAVVKSVVGLCRDLDTLLIGEGVETRAEAITLRDLGIRYMQGYALAHPAFERLPGFTMPF